MPSTAVSARIDIVLWPLRPILTPNPRIVDKAVEYILAQPDGE